MADQKIQDLYQSTVVTSGYVVPLAYGTYLTGNISGITNANPGVVTATAHGLSNGDRVYIAGVSGMTEVNGNTYVVANKTTNTFEIQSTNTTGYGTYASGGYFILGRLQNVAANAWLISSYNLSDVPNTTTARQNLGLGSGNSPEFLSVNIGHATDTTITRVSAGVIAVEGATVVVQGGALGTPASATLTNCTGLPINTGLTIGSQAQGDILYYNGSAWTRLGAGTSGHFLKTQGVGANPTWDAVSGGTPAGSNTQVQYNNSGSFGGDAGFSYNDGTNELTVTGGLDCTGATVKADQLALQELDATYWLRFDVGSSFTADRTLTLNLPDSNVTLTISGTATIPAGTALVAGNNLSDVTTAATAFSNIKQAATTTATGVVELATDGESGSGVVVVGNDNRLLGSIGWAGGRLTTESGVPVSTSDRSAQGTIYYTLFADDRIWLYDGTKWCLKTFTERSLALSGLTSGKNYDVFLYDNGGTLTLELSAAWTNNTTRADALTTQDGVYVKSGATTRRWIGTIRASGTATVEDTATQRYVWNAGQQVWKMLAKDMGSSSHTYNSNTVRQYNADSTAKFEFVCGLPADQLLAGTTAYLSAPASAKAKIGYGLNSTTVYYSVGAVCELDSGTAQTNTAFIPSIAPATTSLGYSYVALLENAPAAATVTINWGYIWGMLKC